MSSVHVPIPENLLSLVNLLTTLAATEPVVTEHVAPIITQLFDYAMTSGKVTDPKMWVRAMQGAIAVIETRHLDDQRLSMIPINRSDDT
ncbi:MAG: hypothetical protein EHM13_11570 [Acidobacteria bacterium]|nr:MAG: hypothetical protein EHM13_11570 [Acidobacteriota bacterium]